MSQHCEKEQEFLIEKGEHDWSQYAQGENKIYRCMIDRTNAQGLIRYSIEPW